MQSGILTDIRNFLKGGKTRTKPLKPGKMLEKPNGFSENFWDGLKDLEARIPPPDVETQPAYQPSFRKTSRLEHDVAAGGGVIKGIDGSKRPR